MSKLETGSTHTAPNGDSCLVVSVSEDGSTGIVFTSDGSRIQVSAPKSAAKKISRKKSKE